MTREQQKRQYIVAGILVLNTISILLFRKYNHLLPESLSYLPLLVTLLICTTGFYLTYLVSSRDKKFALLFVPATVLLLAILTFLWEHL